MFSARSQHHTLLTGKSGWVILLDLVSLPGYLQNEVKLVLHTYVCLAYGIRNQKWSFGKNSVSDNPPLFKVQFCVGILCSICISRPRFRCNFVSGAGICSCRPYFRGNFLCVGSICISRPYFRCNFVCGAGICISRPYCKCNFVCGGGICLSRPYFRCNFVCVGSICISRPYFRCNSVCVGGI